MTGFQSQLNEDGLGDLERPRPRMWSRSGFMVQNQMEEPPLGNLKKDTEVIQAGHLIL